MSILNYLGVTSVTNRQTNGRTDVLVANAALNYVARPKSHKTVYMYFTFWGKAPTESIETKICVEVISPE